MSHKDQLQIIYKQIMNFFIPTPNLKYKTTLCKAWEDGECFRNSYCNFAHGQGELRTIEQNNQRMSQQKMLIETYYSFNNPVLDNSKTVKCRFYSRGNCKRGYNCTFAHDNQELKSPGLKKSSMNAASLQTNISCEFQNVENQMEHGFVIDQKEHLDV